MAGLWAKWKASGCLCDSGATNSSIRKRKEVVTRFYSVHNVNNIFPGRHDDCLWRSNNGTHSAAALSKPPLQPSLLYMLPFIMWMPLFLLAALRHLPFSSSYPRLPHQKLSLEFSSESLSAASLLQSSVFCTEQIFCHHVASLSLCSELKTSSSTSTICVCLACVSMPVLLAVS